MPRILSSIRRRLDKLWDKLPDGDYNMWRDIIPCPCGVHAVEVRVGGSIRQYVADSGET